MIRIKIDNKKTKIKTESEITVSDYLYFASKDFNEVDILAYLLNISSDKLLMFEMPNNFWDAFGNLKDISASLTEFPTPLKVFQRHQITNCKKEGLELMLYTLAVSEVNNIDISKVNSYYDFMMSKPYFETLNKAYHSFDFFLNGRKPGKNILHSLISFLNTKLKRNRLIFKS